MSEYLTKINMSELENFRTPTGVEIPINIQWWLVLIMGLIMPICLIGASITDPAFREFEGMVLIITITAITSGLLVVVSFLLRRIIKRFSWLCFHADGSAALFVQCLLQTAQ